MSIEMEAELQQEQLLRAREAQDSGRFDEAVKIYEQLLARVPDHREALQRLARLEVQLGHRRAARWYLERFVALEPENAAARHEFALSLAELNEFDKALAETQEADRLKPNSPEILNNIGCLLKRMGRPLDAIKYHEQAVTVTAENAVLSFNLGSALLAAGRLDDAVPILRVAATLDPNLAEAWAGLGEALLKRGNTRSSVGPLRRALELKPDDGESRYWLAGALQNCGQFEEALLCYLQAAERHPDAPDVWFGIGRCQLECKRFTEAVEAFQKCLKLEPDHSAAIHEQGKTLFKLGCVEQAMKALRLATKKGSKDIETLALQNMAVMIPGNPTDTNRTVLEVRQTWGRRLVSRPQGPHLRDPGTGPLRIGYVSSFFQGANWMKPVWALINRHDREQFQIELFSDASLDRIEHGYRPDPRDQFHDITGQSNEAVAARIAARGIDILVDLNGYSDMARLPLFALRPAPIIVAWFNMYATTGLDCFDYLIGDESVIPAKEESFYTERILRLPNSYLAFEVDHPVPDITPPPVVTTGQLTIGCLASQYKITDQVVATWADILRGSPKAQMLIRNSALGRTEHCEHLSQRFAAKGISRDRLILEGPAEHLQFLSTYNRIDFAVDSFPYSGGTTTMEALWQGVPVVTFNGDRWVSRTSVSLLKSAGLDEFVRSSVRDYTDFCIRLANSTDTPSKLEALRADIRQRLRASPVCDAAALARSMEHCYRQMVSEKLPKESR
ncbi:tetratricopeptide repeat protein [Schlesneria paludicola]|uniref:tetratricopeptide repeat protein n=1 Tax=Schlesneria paludicola TaxID=360056 RepID=UPI001ED949F1|nr:tetratricopeptide repeat protein [Schlesneria paludicola]